MINAKTVLKIAGIVVNIAGIGLGFATDFIETKKMEEIIAEKVAEALAAKAI